MLSTTDSDVEDFPSSWESLPHEILEGKIFFNLDFSSFIACSLCCKSWNQSSVLVYDLYMDLPCRRQNDRNVASYGSIRFIDSMKQFSCLRSLTLSVQPSLTPSHFAPLAPILSQSLTSLSLAYCTETRLSASESTSFNFSSWFPKLKKLELLGCEIGLASINSSTFPTSLSSLNISCSTKIRNQSIVEMSKITKNLQTLELRGLYRLENSGIADITKANPNIVHLDISSIPSLNDACLKVILTNCKKMESFVAKKTNFTDVGISMIPEYWASTLKYISIKMCPNIGDVGVLGLVRGCTKLKTLDIQHIKLSASAELFEAVSLNCPDLRTLDIRDCIQLDMDINTISGENAFAQFLQKCQKLEVLYLRSPAVFDRHLQFIANEAKQLVGLYIQSCINVSENGIKLITDAANGGSLRYLRRLLATEIPFDHAQVEALAMSCKSLNIDHLKWNEKDSQS